MGVGFLLEIKIIKTKREQTRTLWNWTGSRDTDVKYWFFNMYGYIFNVM